MGPPEPVCEAWEKEKFCCSMPEIELQLLCHADRRLVSECMYSPIADHKILTFIHKMNNKQNSAKRIYK